MTTSVSGGIEKLVWIMICFLPIYSVGRLLWLRRRGAGMEGKRFDRAREIILALFALFMFGLLALTFENHGFAWLWEGNPILRARRRLQSGIGVNFVPFRTIRMYLRHAYNRENLLVNIAGNIVMFLPWGFGLPLLWKKNQHILKVTLMSVFLPACIEFLQLFIGRSVDVDDIILNFIGGMAGGFLYVILAQIFPRLKGLAR